MAEEKKYVGYGYHGGSRKATGIKRISISISGQPEELEQLKENAAAAGKTVSAFVLDTLVRNYPGTSLKENKALDAEINLAPLGDDE